MDARHRGIQIFGWFFVVAGYILALLLIRGIFIGTTRGFAGHPNIPWVVLGYLLFFAIAFYLFAVGRRLISVAKGKPRPKPRFGWGRIVLGALVIFGAATAQFHLLPLRHFIRQEHQKQAQTAAQIIPALVVYVSCVLLILSGIRKGFRRAPTPGAEAHMILPQARR